MRDIDFFTKLLSLKRPWKVDRVSLSLYVSIPAAAAEGRSARKGLDSLRIMKVHHDDAP